MIDRTTEFQGCIRVLRRGSEPSSAQDATPPTGESEFAQAVAHVAAGFEGTAKLNEQLMRLVSRKGASNDPTQEISDVSRLFKGDMDSLQRELAMLQAYVEGTSGRRGGPAAGSQRQKHCSYIVAALKLTAQQQTQSFQSALKQRTTVLKEQNERRKHYSHTRNVGLKVQLESPLFNMSNGSGRVSTAPLSAPNSGSGAGNGGPASNRVQLQSASPLMNAAAPSSGGTAWQQQQSPDAWTPPPAATAGGSGSAHRYQNNTAALPLPATVTAQQQQYGSSPAADSSKRPVATPTPGGTNGAMGLRRRGVNDGSDTPHATWQVQELQQHSTHRLDEARRVESMIGELGSMFSKFSTLVAQQEELVVHIEDDVEMAHGFAAEGQAHLSKYYRTISGNRGLIIKIFLALAFFIWLFTVAT